MTLTGAEYELVLAEVWSSTESRTVQTCNPGHGAGRSRTLTSCSSHVNDSDFASRKAPWPAKDTKDPAFTPVASNS
ncbi:hypothetical protein NtRootA1_17950 [Arthrobacter sp. NtRootA1]|nr:hypothetical protein NtRootA1_17950 [Arthrobacter sp. NtRootA1]